MNKCHKTLHINPSLLAYTLFNYNTLNYWFISYFIFVWEPFSYYPRQPRASQHVPRYACHMYTSSRHGDVCVCEWARAHAPDRCMFPRLSEPRSLHIDLSSWPAIKRQTILNINTDHKANIRTTYTPKSMHIWYVSHISTHHNACIQNTYITNTYVPPASQCTTDTSQFIKNQKWEILLMRHSVYVHIPDCIATHTYMPYTSKCVHALQCINIYHLYIAVNKYIINPSQHMHTIQYTSQ